MTNKNYDEILNLDPIPTLNTVDSIQTINYIISYFEIIGKERSFSSTTRQDQTSPTRAGINRRK